MVANAAPAAMPPGVFADELGRSIAPLEVLVPYERNPRDPSDFDPEQNPSFAGLMNSIDQVGVREPIFVYPAEGRCYMQNGHRRREAVIQINAQRERAYESQLKLGSLKAGAPRPAELEPMPGVPITLVAPPESEFDQEANMWLSESQREKWPPERMFAFYKATYDAAPKYFQDDPKELAGRLGLTETRTKLLNTIANSPALYGAAVEVGADALPRLGREKTLRSVSRVADVIFYDRRDVAIRATGRYKLDLEAQEAIRKLVIGKAKEYARSQRPPGVALERTAPELRKPEAYPDDEVLAWLTGPGVIAEERMPTTVGGSKASGGDNGKAEIGLADLLEQFKTFELKSYPDEKLNSFISDLTKAGEILDTVLASARTERRSRI